MVSLPFHTHNINVFIIIFCSSYLLYEQSSVVLQIVSQKGGTVVGVSEWIFIIATVALLS